MNAAGRMDTAKAVVELFLTNDAARARDLARQLHDQNTERQQVEAEIREICEQIAVADGECALVYYAEDWHRGVLGIVASRLVERFHRPVFVLGRNAEDGLASGSGRSIPAFHLLDALESMPDLFVRFGGHEHAAGVTMDAGARAASSASASTRMPRRGWRPRISCGGWRSTRCSSLREISERAIDERVRAGALRPRQSRAAVRRVDVEVAGPPAVWKEKHLKLMVRQNGRTLVSEGVELRGAGRRSWRRASRVDMAFSLEEDAYSAARGYPGWAAILRDFRPA